MTTSEIGTSVPHTIAELARSSSLPAAADGNSWPPRRLVELIDASSDAISPSDAVAQILLRTTLETSSNHEAARLEAALRRRLPLPAQDQIDFMIATHLVNHDEYLRWMIQMLGGWLNLGDGNCQCFSHAIRHMPPGGAVVEIGSFLGVSICAISYLLLRHDRLNTLWNTDPWAFEETEKPIGGFFDAASPAYRDYCVETYKRNVELFAARRPPTTIAAFSDDFFRAWATSTEIADVFGKPAQLGGAISFAYIDGAHTYEAARNDFENVCRHLLPGGFVLFDDSNPRLSFGCVRTAAEAAAVPGFRRVFTHVDGLNVLLQKSS